MMRLAVALAVMIWAGAAAADLYRWVDPESGSVKFSSYPPPWYGDKAKQRRAPRVVLIPAGRGSPAQPAEPEATADPVKAGDETARSASRGLEALEAQRKQLLEGLKRLPSDFDFARAGTGFRQQIEALQSVSVEMDRLDRKGAEGRLAEVRFLVERIAAGSRPQPGALPQPAR